MSLAFARKPNFTQPCTHAHDALGAWSVPGNRAPYHRHVVTIDRSPQSGRLRCFIESYGAPDERSNPDNVAARVEFGLLHKVMPALLRLQNIPAWHKDAVAYLDPMSFVEFVNDTSLGRELARLGVRMESELVIDRTTSQGVISDEGLHVVGA